MTAMEWKHCGPSSRGPLTPGSASNLLFAKGWRVTSPFQSWSRREPADDRRWARRTEIRDCIDAMPDKLTRSAGSSLGNEVRIIRDVFGNTRFRGLRPVGDRQKAEFDDARLDLVTRQHGKHGLADPLDEVRRRSGRREQEVFGAQVDVRIAQFLEGRHIGKGGPS